MSQPPIPAVSVGILTHNYARYIKDAIESVLRQSWEDFELTIFDDASADDTQKVVEPYLADRRVRYVRHATNLGQAGNWGFALTSGAAPILAVLHADDYWLPGALATALQAFERERELDLFYGNFYRRHEPMGEKDPSPALPDPPHSGDGASECARQARRFTCLPSASFLSRLVINKASLPDRRLHMLVDHEYFLRLAAHARRTRFDPAPLTVYRVHRSSMTATTAANGTLAAEICQFSSICAERAAACPPLSHELGTIAVTMARSLYSTGVSAAAAGDFSTGRNLIRKAASLSPRIWFSPKYLVDRILTVCDPLARPVFMKLHGRRVPGRPGGAPVH